MRTLGQRYAQRSKPKLEKAWDAQGILLRFQFLELEDLALRVIFAPGAAVRLREKETDLASRIRRWRLPGCPPPNWRGPTRHGRASDTGPARPSSHAAAIAVPLQGFPAGPRASRSR